MNWRIWFSTFAVLFLSAGIVFAQGSNQGASGSSQSSRASAHILIGEVLDLEGQMYTVEDGLGAVYIKDNFGQVFRFVVHSGTQVQGPFKKGDKIELGIAADGTAEYIKKAGN